MSEASTPAHTTQGGDPGGVREGAPDADTTRCDRVLFSISTVYVRASLSLECGNVSLPLPCFRHKPRLKTSALRALFHLTVGHLRTHGFLGRCGILALLKQPALDHVEETKSTYIEVRVVCERVHCDSGTGLQ